MPKSQTRKSQRRGAVRKATSQLVAFWVPDHIAEALDREVAAQDSDRSKVLRAALRRHLERAS